MNICLKNWLKPYIAETFGDWKLEYRSQNSSTSLILLKNKNDANIAHTYPCPSFEISEFLSRGWSYYDPSTSRWRDSYDIKFSCLCGTWIQIKHSIPKLTFHPKLNQLELPTYVEYFDFSATSYSLALLRTSIV